ncbi:hypothetical protein [Pararhizobium sp. O133]|uniref:hypothetical protein n=1 Tax=Pararhizobium sp. O133 TaxID=3449278 RepID=UPI003F685C65
MANPGIQARVDYVREVGEGAAACMIAKVDLIITRDERDPRGDNLSIHVQLPPDSGSMNFENLQALAVAEAIQLLTDSVGLPVQKTP